MPSETPDEVKIQRAYENFRQERETFDQLKKHDEYWFILKMIMGGCSVFVMIVVLFFSIYIIINNSSFPQYIVYTGGGGFIIDIIASSASVWKLTMNPKSMSELKPITSISPIDNEEE
jgi:hypothetical protein